MRWYAILLLLAASFLHNQSNLERHIFRNRIIAFHYRTTMIMCLLEAQSHLTQT